MRAERLQAVWRGAARAIAYAVLLLIVLAGYAGRQTVRAGQDDNSRPFRVSIDVALVVLHATVSNQESGFVADLKEQDFKVYEAGVAQRIQHFSTEDLPVTVGLVIDHSTTMLPKLPEVITAARTFVRLSNRDDEMFVVNFADKPTLGLLRAVRFTADPAELERAIAAAPVEGETALYDAIARALDELQAGSRDRKALIVVSDGGDNASAHNLGQVMKLAGRSNAVIYTIGIYRQDDPDRNPDVLRRLAQATGGESFLPGQTENVEAVCKRIARDMRHQYTIGYVPISLPPDGAYRAIRVEARAQGHGKLTVRTRTGYIGGGEPRLGEKSAK